MASRTRARACAREKGALWCAQPRPPARIDRMFRPTDPQQSLLECRFLVPPAKKERLEKSWAQVFRDRILPVVDEEVFRDCFHESNGRPNKSIRLLMGVHMLKEWDDLTDEQVIEAVEFNLLWQHALGVEPEDAHVCQKTLHNFRVRLLENERAAEMFDRITRRLVEMDGLNISRQRLDSTHVVSNIAVLTRLGVFVETVTRFLKELRRGAPSKLEALHPGYCERYLDREGYFADAKKGQAQRRLPMVAQDVLALVRTFESDEEVREWGSYALLLRLLEEQCDIKGDDGDGEAGGNEPPVEVKEPKKISGQSLQSPHDPDATYGHKGKGYEVQVAETCVEENPYQVISEVQVNGAHESDHQATVPVVENLQAKGLGPDEMLADTTYDSGENIIECARRGVELVAPVHDPDAPPAPERWQGPVEGQRTPETEEGDSAPAQAATSSRDDEDGPLGLESFAFNATYDEVLACPAGNPPVSAESSSDGARHRATFDGPACALCPLSERCPARARSVEGDRVLRWRAAKAATAARQLEQRTSPFKERYKLRSGIESTNAELKHRHGAARLRVRGSARVALAMHLKALAVNVKRAAMYHAARLTTDSPPAEAPALV